MTSFKETYHFLGSFEIRFLFFIILLSLKFHHVWDNFFVNGMPSENSQLFLRLKMKAKSWIVPVTRQMCPAEIIRRNVKCLSSGKGFFLGSVK